MSKNVDRVIPIVRGLFDPTKLLGDGWEIIKSEVGGHSEGLTELDLNKVEFVFESTKNTRLISLDADMFLSIRENKRLIPANWRENDDGSIRYICFDGTPLSSSLDGNRFALYLYYRNGEWVWGVECLYGIYNSGKPLTRLRVN